MCGLLIGEEVAFTGVCHKLKGDLDVNVFEEGSTMYFVVGAEGATVVRLWCGRHHPCGSQSSTERGGIFESAGHS